MARPMKTLLTNWIDGMKLNKSLFENSESALLRHIQIGLSAFINNNNFGLIHKKDLSQSSFELKVSKFDNENYKIVLKDCFAITYNGAIIDISADTGNEVSQICKLSDLKELNSKNPEYYLALSVNYEKRIPTGEPNVTEQPLRQPFVIPEYRLELIPSETYNISAAHGNILVVGKFLIANNALNWDESYIPACTSISSHPELIKAYDAISENVNIVQISLYNIIYKVINKNQKSPLAFNIKVVCEKVIYQVSSLFFSLKHSYQNYPPINLVSEISCFANQLKMSIDFLPEKEKEDMLLYFKEWSDVSPAKFEEFLNYMIHLDYNHQEISESFDTVLEFTTFISELLKRLSELDLIGKRKTDKNMVVRETGTKAKKGFRMID